MEGVEGVEGVERVQGLGFEKAHSIPFLDFVFFSKLHTPWTVGWTDCLVEADAKKT